MWIWWACVVSLRRLSVAFAVILVVGLFSVAVAQATVTQSSITSPSDPFFGFDQGQTQNVPISGTSDGTTGDQVDILCYNDDGSTGNRISTVASSVPVNGDGTFSVTVPITDLLFSHVDFTPGYCRLRAVPAGTAPAAVSSFAGPRALVGRLQKFTSGSVVSDFYIVDPQLKASDDFNSYGGCGLTDSYLFDSSVAGQLDSLGFHCNDWVDTPAMADPSRAGVAVDGHPAYAPELADGINTGSVALTINQITQNPSNGDLTISETDPLVVCPGDPFPATSSNCPAFSPSGVQVKRTITQTDDGHIVYIEDQYSSTDGASHAVDLLLENDQFFDSASGSFFGDTDVSYEFPGQSSFSPGMAGETVPVPSASPASILVENSAVADGSTSAARGAITYGQPPSGPFAFSTFSFFGDVVFDVANAITVPASGTVPIRFAYSTEFTLADVQRDALTAEDHFQPATVSFSSPANGATVTSSPVTVTGSASAGSGVKSVTVNGVAAPVSGGSFSASVPLSKGANTLTAVVTSTGGATGSASEPVTFAPTSPFSPTSPSPTPTAPLATTDAAKSITATGATLTGLVVPGSASATYQFEFGTSTAYGTVARSGSLAASGLGSSLSAPVIGLSPGSTYHFRVVASSSAGNGDGKDASFTTPKAALKKVGASVKPRRDHKAPYEFEFAGSITPPAGVSKQAACAGAVSVTAGLGKHKVTSLRVKVSRKCRFAGRVSFGAKKLSGKGKLQFGFRFDGNRVLAPKSGKAVTVHFG